MTAVYRDESIQAQTENGPASRAGKTVVSFERLSEVIQQVTEIARRMLNASGSSILLLDKEDSALIFKVATGRVSQRLAGLRISTQNGIASWVARYGEPLIVNDVRGDWRFDKIVDTATGFITRSVVCTPLVENRRIVGVIEVVNKADGTPFGNNDLEILASIANVAVLSILHLTGENGTTINHRN